MKKLLFVWLTLAVALTACNKAQDANFVAPIPILEPIVIEGQDGFQGVTTLPATLIVGEVSYRQRIALTTPYTLELELFEVDGEASTSVAPAQSTIQENQVPINFVFSYDSSLIDSTKTYGLQARIIENDVVTWQNNPLVNPFTTPRTNISIMVDPVQ